MGRRRTGVLLASEAALLIAAADVPDYAPVLAERSGLNLRTVTRTLRRLEAQGYLRSRWRIAAPHAQLVFTITPKGRRALARG